MPKMLHQGRSGPGNLQAGNTPIFCAVTAPLVRF